MRREPPGDEELRDSQTFLAGSYRLHHQSAAQMAQYLAFYEACGLGYRYDAGYVNEIRSVTGEDVMRAARCLHEDNFLTVTMRPKGGMAGVAWRLLKERFRR